METQETTQSVPQGINIPLELIKLLNQIRSEINVGKNQRNNFGGYNYRNCEDILENAKPILQKHNAIITLTDEIVFIGTRFYVKAVAKLICEFGEIEAVSYAREEEVKKGMDGSQITGASSSYARKYALNALLLLDDVKDADATNKHEKEEPAKATNTAKSAPATANKVISIEDVI